MDLIDQASMYHAIGSRMKRHVTDNNYHVTGFGSRYKDRDRYGGADPSPGFACGVDVHGTVGGGCQAGFIGGTGG